ncbi:thiol peroxidase [Streptococcus sp. zg-JUN1979]|uniref:thiol peroxidase n=1 Tax=Streptococcus sp. zg-JUN1979 TaxID=3391450 RepID=UPI0039A5FFE9
MTTFLGKPVTLIGEQLAVGQVAPDFTAMTTDLTLKSLSDFTENYKVISVVPSIDTGICSTQTRTFNQVLSNMPDTVVITISKDLPFAQARWCGAEGLEKAVMLSDYREGSFGKTYGLLMQEWNLLARAVLILDKDNRVTYVDYVDNVNSEPDYDKAVAALKALID